MNKNVEPKTLELISSVQNFNAIYKVFATICLHAQ